MNEFERSKVALALEAGASLMRAAAAGVARRVPIPDDCSPAEAHGRLAGGQAAAEAILAIPLPQIVARPLAEWRHEDGFVTWWKFPVDEPAWIGSPGCSDWPGYHTHWTPHPTMPTEPQS